jgi:hypothetical protein
LEVTTEAAVSEATQVMKKQFLAVHSTFNSTFNHVDVPLNHPLECPTVAQPVHARTLQK